MRNDRRCLGRLEQEHQRLKKHYDRWMDIVRSLELESFILTKLTKPSIPVNLVGTQVILPLWWVPASRGYSFFCVIRRHFLACEDIAGGSELSAGGTFFFAKYRGPSGGSQLSGGGIIILRVQSMADGCRSLTTLTRQRREHHGGGRRRGLGRERHEAGEDSAMVAHAVGSTRVYWSGCHRRKITGGVGE